MPLLGTDKWKDEYKDNTNGVGGVDWPAADVKSVTPSDGADLPDGPCRGLYVGGAGNISLVTANGTTVTFNGLGAGQFVPVRATRVRATSTTATNILALY